MGRARRNGNVAFGRVIVAGTRSAILRVTTSKLVKRFGEHRALAGVDLELRASRVTAVLGHNGAGKSTLVNILSTLARASSGDVTFHGAGGALADENIVRREVGLLAHASLCYAELTARENLAFFAGLAEVDASAPRLDALLDQVGLDPNARSRPARTFSRGMWQRLALARALVADPTLVLLDEPFTGLDRGGALALGQRLAALRDTGALVLVVTHDLEAIGGLTDDVVVLRQGKIAHRASAPTLGAFDYDQLKSIYSAHSG